MSANIENNVTNQEQPKSKRLSSLIWIGVLWLFVYLISGLDGISWKRAFNGVGFMFGLWPATFFLGVSTLPYVGNYQSVFRWAAFAVIFGSFLGGMLVFIVFNNGQKMDDFTISIQWLMVILVPIGVGIHWVKGAKHD